MKRSYEQEKNLSEEMGRGRKHMGNEEKEIEWNRWKTEKMKETLRDFEEKTQKK
jgi:hypothetical protein